MDKVLLALGGVALGVAAYTLGEMVQERRAEMGEDLAKKLLKYQNRW